LAQDFADIMNDLDALQRRADRIDAGVNFTEVSTPTNYFTNSWVNYSIGYHQEAQYRRIGDVVELRGMIKSGTIGSAALTLPVGFRPGGGHHLFPTDSNANAHGRVDAQSDGQIIPRVPANAYTDIHARWSVSEVGVEGWTAVSGGIGFKNSWVNFGGGYAPAAYRRVGDMVEVRGLITGGTLNVAAFTLPTGYRPTKTVHFSADSSAVTFGHGELTVEADGDVIPVSGSNSYYGLFTMRFSVSPTGTEGWTKVIFGSGWSNYDVSLYVPAEYRLVGDEVQLRGLVAGGSGTIFTLPEGHRPCREHLWCVDATNAHARVDITSDGQVSLLAGTSTYLTLSGMHFSVLP